MPEQYYVSRERLTLTTDPATGDRVEPDFDSAGPFATAAQAQAYGEARGWQGMIVRASQPLPGMVPCPTCGLLVWEDDPHPEHDGGHVANPALEPEAAWDADSDHTAGLESPGEIER